MDSRELAEESYRRAFELNKQYGCCPQSVLVAVKETVGGVSDDTIKASHGLTGGGSLVGTGMCGALSGGLIALGTRHGRDADKLNRGRGMINFEAGRRLVERFDREYGGHTCRHLQKVFTGRTWDFWKPDDYRGFTDARGDKCARATALVAQWVVSQL